MPIYEYQCDSCHYRFEVKQSIKDEPLSTCERCGKPVRRLISSPGIMFKGSGWYVTDYSDKMKPPSAGEPAAASTSEAKKDAGANPPAAPSPTATPPSSSTSPSSESSTASSGSATPSSSTAK